ncbi:hypothetical protein OESDEN_04701 [Oesophagostomum dentatum]|uniref:Uncharacterized protein n=1 Tax=Oesophagostomum dentatum TaxID=61180 RepID=A0A0B1TGW9_OESDE|nr:hypothetical protein OESDEN_04701 [Oesophagostomum dentatum]
MSEDNPSQDQVLPGNLPPDEGPVSGAESATERGSSVLSEPRDVNPCGELDDDECWAPGSEGTVVGPSASGRIFTMADVSEEVPVSVRSAYLANLLKYPAITPRHVRSCSPFPVNPLNRYDEDESRSPPHEPLGGRYSSFRDESSRQEYLRGYVFHRSFVGGGRRGRRNVPSLASSRQRGPPSASVSASHRGQSTRGQRGWQRRGYQRQSGVPARQRHPLQQTPPGYNHHLSGHHPWANNVRPREVRSDFLSDADVSNQLSVLSYPHIPASGYTEQFATLLFSIFDVRPSCVPHGIPFLELQTLEAAVAFRYLSLDVTKRVFDRTYQHIENVRPQASPNEFPTLIVPPTIDGIRPVLYQVVKMGRGLSAILEAKDFFISMPDRPDLSCIIFDQFATNIQTDLRGFAC